MGRGSREGCALTAVRRVAGVVGTMRSATSSPRAGDYAGEATIGCKRRWEWATRFRPLAGYRGYLDKGSATPASGIEEGLRRRMAREAAARREARGDRAVREGQWPAPAPPPGTPRGAAAPPRHVPPRRVRAQPAAARAPRRAGERSRRQKLRPARPRGRTGRSRGLKKCTQGRQGLQYAGQSREGWRRRLRSPVKARACWARTASWARTSPTSPIERTRPTPISRKASVRPRLQRQGGQGRGRARAHPGRAPGGRSEAAQPDRRAPEREHLQHGAHTGARTGPARDGRRTLEAHEAGLGREGAAHRGKQEQNPPRRRWRARERRRARARKLEALRKKAAARPEARSEARTFEGKLRGGIAAGHKVERGLEEGLPRSAERSGSVSATTPRSAISPTRSMTPRTKATTSCTARCRPPRAGRRGCTRAQALGRGAAARRAPARGKAPRRGARGRGPPPTRPPRRAAP